MDTCICTAKPFCCSPKTITILLISYTPMQDKKLKKKKKNSSKMSFLISLPKWYYILEFPYVFFCSILNILFSLSLQHGNDIYPI